MEVCETKVNLNTLTEGSEKDKSKNYNPNENNPTLRQNVQKEGRKRQSDIRKRERTGPK